MATQAIFGALAQLFPASVDATPSDNSSFPISPSSQHVLSLHSIPTLLLSLATKNQDVVKLMVIGGFIETFRRFYSQLWAYFLNSFFITAHFQGTDDAFDWIMIWLSKQSIWDYANEVNISTDSWGKTHHKGVEIPDSVEQSLDNSIQSKRKLTYLPAYGTTHWLRYKRTWVSVYRSKAEIRDAWSRKYDETISICLFTRDHRILRSLLQDAKKVYRTDDDETVGIYGIGSMDDWDLISTRKKRPLNSIVLEPEIKDMILNDAKEFLSTEQWYTERGIPYRRGYLLHGVPGSGKTSLIHSIAGELGLDIYIISLAKRGLDDSKLTELICSLPPRSIVLMEDIDAAFIHAATARDDPVPKAEGSSKPREEEPPSRVTLSGLLSALDGVAAQEGRLLFATTNRYHVLDQALCRPGRMDLHVEFKNATSWQAQELFRRFFPPGEVVRKMEDGEKDIETRLTLQQVDELARRFAEEVPRGQFSMASLQGHLMRFKERPYEAVEAVAVWVGQETLKRGVDAKLKDS